MGLFLDLFTEGVQTERGVAMLKRAGKEDMVDDFLKLTKSHKSGKYMPALVKFYLEENGPDFQTIGDYYKRYISIPKLRNQKRGIEKYRDFHHFESEIDAIASTEEKGGDVDDITDTPVYEDNNVAVFYGSDKQKCIKYGRGYTFCISQATGSNLYWGYRAKGATFYFVRFKKKELIKSPVVDQTVVIHAYPNNEYYINYSKPNRDFRKPKEEIIKEIPTLKKPFEEGVFAYIPLSEKEEKIIKYIDKTSDINDLKTIEDKLTWIELGKRIVPNMVGYGKDTLPLWQKYIEVGIHDLEGVQKKGLQDAGFVKLLKRYNQKVAQRFDIKIAEGGWNRLTHDEKIHSLKSGYLKNWFKEKKYKEESFPSWYSDIFGTDIFAAYSATIYEDWVNALKDGLYDRRI